MRVTFGCDDLHPINEDFVGRKHHDQQFLRSGMQFGSAASTSCAPVDGQSDNVTWSGRAFQLFQLFVAFRFYLMHGRSSLHSPLPGKSDCRS
jgi:hypothetical protein